MWRTLRWMLQTHRLGIPMISRLILTLLMSLIDEGNACDPETVFFYRDEEDVACERTMK